MKAEWGIRNWGGEWGLRPVGAEEAYAPEGRRKGEEAQCSRRKAGSRFKVEVEVEKPLAFCL